MTEQEIQQIVTQVKLKLAEESINVQEADNVKASEGGYSLIGWKSDRDGSLDAVRLPATQLNILNANAQAALTQSNSNKTDIATINSSLAGQLKKDIYTLFGATYNATSGYWELNGLTDITDAQMDEIYLATHDYRPFKLAPNLYKRIRSVRTNLYPYNRNSNMFATNNDNNLLNGFYAFYGASEFEVLKLCDELSSDNSQGMPLRNANAMFANCSALKKIVGVLNLSKCTDTASMFSGCANLEEVSIYGLGRNLTIPSAKISETSLEFLIANHNQDAVTFSVSVHADVYSKAMQLREKWSSICNNLYIASI